jgi:hypothetical protein
MIEENVIQIVNNVNENVPLPLEKIRKTKIKMINGERVWTPQSILRKKKAIEERREPTRFGPPPYLEFFEFEKLKNEILKQTMQDQPLQLGEIRRMACHILNKYIHNYFK